MGNSAIKDEVKWTSKMQFKVRKRLQSYQLGPPDPRNELGIILNPFFHFFLTLSKMVKFQKIRYFQSPVASQKSLKNGSDGYGAGPGVWTDGSDPIWPHLTHILGVLGLQKLDIKKGQKFNSDFSYYWFRQPIWGQIWVIWVLGRPRGITWWVWPHLTPSDPYFGGLEAPEKPTKG